MGIQRVELERQWSRPSVQNEPLSDRPRGANKRLNSSATAHFTQEVEIYQLVLHANLLRVYFFKLCSGENCQDGCQTNRLINPRIPPYSSRT